MATKSKRHTHKYHRIDLGSYKVWACALPDCMHHMPPHYNNLVEGKNSFCWKCGEMFVLNAINMKMDKPICDDCSTTKTNLDEYLRDKGLINPVTNH